MSRVRRFTSHLSYANVMATVAVFIALGGGAYAASKAGKNSVNSRAIVNGQVKSSDLKNNGVTGKDVKESSLGSVPNALKLEGQGASKFQTNSATAAQNWKPLLDPNRSRQACYWDSYGGGFATPSYYRDQDGTVHLRGLLKGTPGSNLPCDDFFHLPGTIATLPTGFRPDSRLLFTITANDKPGRVDVDDAGNVFVEPDYPANLDAIAFLSLDGITFRAKP